MSIQLDHSIEKVIAGVSAITPMLPEGEYVIYGGAFRAFLEGRIPADYDVAIQGTDTPDPSPNAIHFGAPSSAEIRKLTCIQDAMDACWSYLGSVYGKDVFLFRKPGPIGRANGIPVSLVGFFSTDYRGNVFYPRFVPTVVNYIDFRVCRAAMDFRVTRDGRTEVLNTHIPPGFEEDVAARTLTWMTDMQCFRREKINRVTRYILNYGYHIPDRPTLNRMIQLLDPPQHVLDLWMLYSPHLR